MNLPDMDLPSMDLPSMDLPSMDLPSPFWPGVRAAAGPGQAHPYDGVQARGGGHGEHAHQDRSA